MSTLKVANIHFEATGTNRVEYVANNINFRTGGGNFTISVGGTESLNVNASSVMISGANILASVAAAATSANAALANTDATFAGNLTLSISRTIFVGNATVNTAISAGSITTNGVAFGSTEATDAQMWAETSTTTMVTPRRLGSAKAWVALTDAATITVDSTLGRNFKLASMAGNRTLGFPSGTLVEGDQYYFLIKQDATGSRTLAYASGYKHDGDSAQAIGTTASKYSLLTGLVLPGSPPTLIQIQLVAVNFTGP